MKRSSFVCAAIATVLLGFASASWAEGITIAAGTTETWSTDKTLDTTGSWFAIDGTLNQTGGMVTANTEWGMVISESNGQVSAYNMSGYAGLITTGGANTKVRFGNSSSSGTGSATWNLTDHATAAIGLLSFNECRGTKSSVMNLSGSAAFNATDVNFAYTSSVPSYISFASGSLATLTVDSKVLADYETFVADGLIRVDGLVQSDFSAFQVSGHTLSLAVPEPGTLALLVGGLIGLVAYAWRKRK